MLYPEQYPAIADRLTADHFYDHRHRAVWLAMGGEWKQRGGFNPVTLADSMSREALSACGGVAYLTLLADHLTTIGASYYVPLVEDAYRRRCLCFATEQVLSDVAASNTAMEALTYLVEATRREEERLQLNADPSMRDALGDMFRLLEACQMGQSGQVETGLKDVDETLVIMPPDLVLLAARPGCGKTAFAMNVAKHMLSLGKPVGYVSLEMGRTQLLMRWMSMLSGVPVDRMRRRNGLEVWELPKLTEIAQEMLAWPLHIEDGTDKTITDIRAIARTWRQKHGIELLIVDYFQLLSGGDGHNSREQEMAHCSRQLKSLCKEIGIPSLVLCQMNREMERRRNSKNPNPRPSMSDLRETGQLEQDADIITFLHRDDDDSDAVSLIIAKQRQGKSGLDVPLRFVRHNQRFETA